MSLVVNTNVGSLFAQRSLAVSSAETKTAMERLSTGSKINSASDDAAGFAISERMTAQINSLNMTKRITSSSRTVVITSALAVFLCKEIRGELFLSGARHLYFSNKKMVGNELYQRGTLLVQ